MFRLTIQLLFILSLVNASPMMSISRFRKSKVHQAELYEQLLKSNEPISALATSLKSACPNYLLFVGLPFSVRWINSEQNSKDCTKKLLQEYSAVHPHLHTISVTEDAAGDFLELLRLMVAKLYSKSLTLTLTSTEHLKKTLTYLKNSRIQTLKLIIGIHANATNLPFAQIINFGQNSNLKHLIIRNSQQSLFLDELIAVIPLMSYLESLQFSSSPTQSQFKALAKHHSLKDICFPIPLNFYELTKDTGFDSSCFDAFYSKVVPQESSDIRDIRLTEFEPEAFTKALSIRKGPLKSLAFKTTQTDYKLAPFFLKNYYLYNLEVDVSIDEDFNVEPITLARQVRSLKFNFKQLDYKIYALLQIIPRLRMLEELHIYVVDPDFLDKSIFMVFWKQLVSLVKPRHELRHIYLTAEFQGTRQQVSSFIAGFSNYDLRNKAINGIRSAHQLKDLFAENYKWEGNDQGEIYNLKFENQKRKSWDVGYGHQV